MLKVTATANSEKSTGSSPTTKSTAPSASG
jgi:hypothetical protein